jgi:hypothetical protein
VRRAWDARRAQEPKPIFEKMVVPKEHPREVNMANAGHLQGDHKPLLQQNCFCFELFASTGLM